MGCSASKAESFVVKDTHSSTLSSSSHSHSHSQCACSTPLSRTLSLPVSFVHHPPKAKGDTEHLVSLTSSTYGFLSRPQDPVFMDQELVDSSPTTTLVSELENVCDCPLTVVNAWELMEGLDEFVCDFENVEEVKGDDELIGDYEVVEYKDCKPLWQHLSVESLLANMDPNVGSSYRKALRSKSVRFGSSEMEGVGKEGFRDSELGCGSKKGIVEMDLDRMKEADGKELHERSSRKWNSEFSVCGREDKIVLYYTSMRGIRKTYQDCCEIRMIFKDYRVFVDERDTSMDPSYRKELQDMLKGKEMSLPQVFVKGAHIGGADKIRKLHEAGSLGEILKEFPVSDPAVACERCGDARFVLCLNCNGSRKVFEENKEKMRCLECNENGLVRCPSC